MLNYKETNNPGLGRSGAQTPDQAAQRDLIDATELDAPATSDPQQALNQQLQADALARNEVTTPLPPGGDFIAGQTAAAQDAAQTTLADELQEKPWGDWDSDEFSKLMEQKSREAAQRALDEAKAEQEERAQERAESELMQAQARGQMNSETELDFEQDEEIDIESLLAEEI